MKFLEALNNRKAQGMVPLIPDIKCFSPKDGELLKGRDPAELAMQLVKAGAPALSVVTEQKEFHGSMEILSAVCRSVSVPVLRKDFITCEKDLEETRSAGAQAILLMVSCLGEERLTQLYHAARRLGLTPFVETHTLRELEFAKGLKAPLIGINNRDILVLERDDGTVTHAGRLLREAKEEGSFYVVESALKDGDDVRRALKSGADGVLVGTAILNAPDPVRRYRTMTRRCAVKICGLMSRADVDACLVQDTDFHGFVVEYPVPVRWNLDRNKAGELLSYLKKTDGSAKTCIVTGGEPDRILALARALRPEYLQLHYRESLEDTARIAECLDSEGIRVIRSIPQDPQARQEMFGTGSLEQIVQKLSDTQVSGVLLDSREASNAAFGGGSLLQTLEGGEESAAQIRRIRKLLADSEKLLIVGGGILPETAGEVISKLQPDWIDVMTGAEDSAGRKSQLRIAQLTEAVRQKL
ncbi:MAG: hypothetical protein IJ106_16445 [Parasporobacterium sp.]|nr:hypothetical protein [Parasporobacterium sp.]MBQ9033017.1 hypothetical protein [Parasporobacterium sp.]